MHITRYYMYKRIKEVLKDGISGKILGISGIENFYPLIKKEISEVIETSYPEVDMQNLPFPDNHFDFVISDQVLEHIENPIKAVKESYRVLKKGGIAVHTTCVLNPLHLYPMDYWRFTPSSLKYICSDFSKIIECEKWGNRIVLFLISLTDRFRFIEVNGIITRFIACYNEKKYPIMSWIIARK